jgi:hypothetical protein
MLGRITRKCLEEESDGTHFYTCNCLDFIFLYISRRITESRELMIFIFSYNREEMLRQVLTDIKGEAFLVLDDGSDFQTENMVKFPHEGKAGFWKKWAFAFKTAEATNDEFFIFMPDDFTDLQMGDILMLHEQHKHEPYVYNIINDGRDSSWMPFKAIQTNEHTIQVGFTDCGFFCNREALKMLNFRINPIDPNRFKLKKNISSGVGQQLTNRFTRHGVKMFKPVRSLAYHGDHPSQMHEDERKINPLISR